MMARAALGRVYEEAFAEVDLSGEEAAALRLRTQMLLAVKDAIRKRRWSQAEAAEALGVKQPRISEILNLRIDKFSVELLVRYLFRLGISAGVVTRRLRRSSK